MTPTLSVDTHKSYAALFVAQHWVSFSILSSDTKAMDCCAGVARFDLNATPEIDRRNSNDKADRRDAVEAKSAPKSQPPKAQSNVDKDTPKKLAHPTARTFYT